MKKFLLICLLALNLGAISAQAHRYYCEVTGKQKDLGGTKIIFDFGTSLTHNFWGDLSNRLKFVDENGNEIERLYSSSVGRFKHANGRLVVFKNDNKIVVHEVGCSGVSEVSSRYE